MLAASGGGHLRQLLDLEAVWSRYEHVFVTEPSAIAEDLARAHRVRLVPHFALGQARLGRRAAMLGGMARNLARSLRIALSERPDVVISTGAGAVFLSALIARMLGARFVVIESFARFNGPSAFGRIARPFASAVVVQSAALAALWPGARLFDPFRTLEPLPDGAKQPLLLATVGATLPFDRLSRAIVAAKRMGAIPEDVVLQTGIGSDVAAAGEPGLRIVETLPFDEIKALLDRAALVLCHGGTGSLVTALRAGCRVIAMPREFARGEHYDDHQSEIVEAFAARGLIEPLRDEADLPAAIARARDRPAVRATTDASALAAWLSGWIEAEA